MRLHSERGGAGSTATSHTHPLPITRQARIVNISCGSVYCQGQPVSDDNLKLVHRIDELHLELPFASACMLRDLPRPAATCREMPPLSGLRFEPDCGWAGGHVSSAMVPPAGASVRVRPATSERQNRNRGCRLRVERTGSWPAGAVVGRTSPRGRPSRRSCRQMRSGSEVQLTASGRWAKGRYRRPQ